jgi:hypothetical protein
MTQLISRCSSRLSFFHRTIQFGLAGTVVFLAFTSSSCAIKIGQQSFDNEILDEASKGAFFELEATLPQSTLPALAKDNSELSLSYRQQSFDTEPDVDLIELDLTWRRFVFTHDEFKPFFGLGLGYYKLQSTTVIDTCPSGFICSGPAFEDIDRKTIAEGYNPHFLIGAYLPIPGSQSEFIVELRHEFFKEDNKIDFKSTTIAAGIRFHF